MSGTRAPGLVLSETATVGRDVVFGANVVVHDGVVIGDCGTHGAPEATGDVEIGYGLAAPYRGQGYGAEVVTGLTGWLRAQHAVGRVVAREVDAANLPSRRCLERAGFRLERDDGALVSYATARS